MARNPRGGLNDQLWVDINIIPKNVQGHCWFMEISMWSLSWQSVAEVGGSQSNRFHLTNWMNSIGLIDIGFSITLFTWVKRKNRATHTQRRLDGALCNMEGRTIWQEAYVHHLRRAFFNHSLILVNFNIDHQPNGYKRPFHFWATWPNLKSVPIIGENWNMNSGLVHRVKFS